MKYLRYLAFYAKQIQDKLKTLFTYEKKNYVHHRDRRNTPEYKKRRTIVENIWCVIAVLIILIFQFPEYRPFIIFLLIFTPILSFAILDDNDDKDDDNE